MQALNHTNTPSQPYHVHQLQPDDNGIALDTVRSQHHSFAQQHIPQDYNNNNINLNNHRNLNNDSNVVNNDIDQSNNVHNRPLALPPQPYGSVDVRPRRKRNFVL